MTFTVLTGEDVVTVLAKVRSASAAQFTAGAELSPITDPKVRECIKRCTQVVAAKL
jgi:hypothetical protein